MTETHKPLTDKQATHIFERLKLKAADRGIDVKYRMPTITQIHRLLNYHNIQHYFNGSTNVVEYRNAGRRYVNSRHDGKEGYKLYIEREITIHDGSKIRSRIIELDTSDSYYSWNSNSYASALVKFIEGDK